MQNGNVLLGYFRIGRRRTIKPNETFEFVYNDCGKSKALNAIHRQFAPYLYPFVIEYCILVVGICCKIYENINHCPRERIDSTANGNDAHSTLNDETTESKQFAHKHLSHLFHISETDDGIFDISKLKPNRFIDEGIRTSLGT